MGITKYILKNNARYLKNIPKPSDPNQGKLVVMELKHVWTPLFVLGSGLILAIMVFTWESLESYNQSLEKIK